MGFFHKASKPARLSGGSGASVELLHRAGCAACPLNASTCRNPKMKPHGPAEALIYVLGETPTAMADKINRPMAGPGKELFLKLVPRKHVDNLRWSNVVRTHSPKDVTSVMMECCRPSVIKDIEATQPEIIIGFGEAPLKWAIGQSGIRKWTGRYIPIQVGRHKCWFFPLTDPTEILKKRRFEGPLRRGQVGSEEEFAWTLEVKRAFAMIGNLPDPEIDTREDALADIVYIDGSNGREDVERVAGLLDDLAQEKVTGVDYETNKTRGYNRDAKILTVAISGATYTLALALRHSKALWSPAHLEEVEQLFENWLLNSRCRKVSHALGFEAEWSALFFGKKTVRPKGRWEDTVTQAWLLDERNKMGKPDCHALEFLTLLHFGLNIKALNNLDQAKLDSAPLDQVLEYNGIDAKYHRRLFLAQDEIIRDEGLVLQYEKMLERIPTMVLTQIKGIPISQKRVKGFKTYYEENLAAIEDEIARDPNVKRFKALMGRSFDPGVPKDVVVLIQKVLKESALNKQEKVSSDYEVLERLQDDHPICKLIIEHRADAKALSTYVLPILAPSALIFDDGLIHPVISTTRTLTSRSSSEEGNQQNWPKHEASKIVRAQVEPAADERVVSFDYGQIQARNIAQECLDEAYIKSFWDERDIHKDWALRAIELYPQYRNVGSMKAFLASKDKQKECRQHMKNNFVFPSFFGAQPRGISINTGIDEDDVALMQEELFGEFPGIKEWQDELLAHYRAHGWITGLTGIKRRAPCNPNQLINAPIQADEAWIVCDAMTRLSKKDDDKLQASMEIHDDLTFVWKKKDIDKLAPIVIDTMLDIPFDWVKVVPMTVEMSIGKNWASLEEVGAYSTKRWKMGKYARKEAA